MNTSNQSSNEIHVTEVNQISNKREDLYYERLKRSNEQEEQVTYTPWLLIRYSENDLGLRPVPSGNSFWLSPDIWVESSDIYGRPVVGQENFVHARLSNLGMAIAVPVKVDFYWIDPSLAFTSANMNLIGTEVIEIPSQGVVDVRCNTPWIPAFLNQGHECLVVNSTNWISDPVINPFQAWNDRHVGQRNVTVIEASCGDMVSFNLKTNNILPIENLTTIHGRIEHVLVNRDKINEITNIEIINQIASYGYQDFDTPTEMTSRFDSCSKEYTIAKRLSRLATLIQQEKCKANNTVIKVPKNGRDIARIGISLSHDSFKIKPEKTGSDFANLLLAKDKMASNRIYSQKENDMILTSARLEPFEQREVNLNLKIPDSAKAGEYIAFHITQSAQEFVLGGYCLIAKIIGKKTL